MQRRKIIRYWIPLIIWMIVIFILSSSLFSSEATGEYIVGFWNSLARHMAHISEYLILFLLFYRALNSGLKEFKYSLTVNGTIGVFIYAISDEFHQHFVPGRHFRLVDLGYDLCGIVLGIAVLKLIIYFQNK